MFPSQGNEDAGTLVLQIAYSDLNDFNRTKVVFLDAGTTHTNNIAGTLTLQ